MLGPHFSSQRGRGHTVCKSQEDSVEDLVAVAVADMECSGEAALPTIGYCQNKGKSVIQHFMDLAFREVRQRKREG